MRRRLNHSLHKRFTDLFKTKEDIARSRDRLRNAIASLQTRMLFHLSSGIFDLQVRTMRIEDRIEQAVILTDKRGDDRDGAVCTASSRYSGESGCLTCCS